MQLATGYEDRKARIEMVPLLDVVFLLLVFFIYAMLSMTVSKGVRVVLPSAAGASEPINSLVITLDKSNELSIDGLPVTMAEAVATSIGHGGSEDSQVLINGDREADLGIAVELLSHMRQAGVEAVSFMVKGGEPEARGPSYAPFDKLTAAKGKQGSEE